MELSFVTQTLSLVCNLMQLTLPLWASVSLTAVRLQSKNIYKEGQLQCLAHSRHAALIPTHYSQHTPRCHLPGCYWDSQGPLTAPRPLPLTWSHSLTLDSLTFLQISHLLGVPPQVSCLNSEG